MSLVQPIPPQTPAGVQRIERAADLRRFLRPDCPAAVWHRAMPSAVRDWLAALDPAQLPSGRVIVPAEQVADVVTHLCDMAGTPACAERDWLEADIAVLANCVSGLLGTRHLRLRLDRVTTNACRRFHVDAITARLVCTYRGTGTQFGIGQAGADPAEVHTVATGDPILLRGSLWPETPRTGLLHRSPPIEGTGETRLVLVLDPVVDPDDAE